MKWTAPSRNDSLLDDALGECGEALRGSVRTQIVEEFSKARSHERSLLRLRDAMRSHRFEYGTGVLFLDKLVKRLDNRTRQAGFHALHDWDGKAERFCDDSIPAELTEFIRNSAAPDDAATRKFQIQALVDYYFLYVSGLLMLRAWDDGTPDARLTQIGQCLDSLQGPEGSGHAFVENVETLLLVVTSHFEPDVTAYDRLRHQVKALAPSSQLRLATVHASLLGSHLRFGLDVTCAGDVQALREDNVPDYPWLLMALATLLRARTTGVWKDSEANRRGAEAWFGGLSADPRAFLGTKCPSSLANSESEWRNLRELVLEHRAELRGEIEDHQPPPKAFSPFAFDFNFPHNLLKGLLVKALFSGQPASLPLNGIFTSVPRDATLDSARLANVETLVGFARASPDTIRGREQPAISYEPERGMRVFERVKGALAP